MGRSSAPVKFCHWPKSTLTHQKICRDLIYDNREFEGDACTYDPLGELTTLFAGKSTKQLRTTQDEDLPLEERLKHTLLTASELV